MRKTFFLMLATTLLMSSCSKQAENKSTAAPPHLEKRGNVTQLVVNGAPWLVLGCELGNSTSSSREYLSPYWQQLKEGGVNTVLAVVSWEQTEPVEGQYDFTVVDNLLADARANDMKLAFWRFSILRKAPLTR